MSRSDTSYEKKYRYLLYRIQQALLDMEVEPKSHRGRRHLENALFSCEATIFPKECEVSHDEMVAIKQELFEMEYEKD